MLAETSRPACGVVCLALLLAGCGGAEPAAGPPRDGSPAWSPDGRRIAFYSERDGNAEIYVMDADGGEPVRLTDHPADEGYPAWSPDGSKIAFDSDRDGNFEIYVMDADGGSVRRLTYSGARDVSAAWSPDGSKIAFMSDRSGSFQVWVMAADGSGQTRLTPWDDATHWFPQFSPGGNRLAFHVGRDVHVMDADGGEPVGLTADPDNGMHPSWSPDGTEIAFMSWRTGSTEIWRMSADGSEQRRLTEAPRGDYIDPRWSPDGSRIAFVHVANGMQAYGPQTIWTMAADGSDLRQLTGR